MSQKVSDQSILHHIRHLVEEEHELLNSQQRDDGDHLRLERLQIELDQCWDLLRQRRARKDAGQDPDAAAVRPPEVVENYEQ